MRFTALGDIGFGSMCYLNLIAIVFLSKPALRALRAIVDAGSFTAAALALGYSQPAVSQMVKRLEQRTGTVLVEKVGRSVRLTEAGAVLARHAAPVLAALDAAEEEVAAIAGLVLSSQLTSAGPTAAQARSSSGSWRSA